MITRADKILLVILIVSIVLSFIYIGGILEQGSGIMVEVDHKLVYASHLDQDDVFTVRGDLGELVLEVSQRRIRVVRSECPNQICVRTGWRSREGDMIVCVPNKTIIRIAETGKEQSVEAVTG